jgi:hypothetical protein
MEIMKVDIDDVLFWMDAIRDSKDRYRTLESFWKGQIASKIWLIEKLKENISDGAINIVIYGGWNGVLASLLFNSDIDIDNIVSVDIDSSCEKTASTVNKRQEIQGRFLAVTADMVTHQCDATVVINTSCEHISQEDYDCWLKNNHKDRLLVLQSNNYQIPEHIRPADSLEQFKNQCGDIDIFWAGELELPLYKRWMIIGKAR